MADTLIAALRDPARFPDRANRVDLIETHISWILLAGDFVYKIKKPVNFGFLDFSTLDKRRRYCEEELRLNRRYAPHIYLAVIPITGTPQQPIIGGDGTAFEYAVKMRRFDDEARLDRLLHAGTVTPEQIDAFAAAVADAHGRAAVAAATDTHAAVAHITQPALDNFSHLQPLLRTASAQTQLAELLHWTQSEITRLNSSFARRAASGAVRECHGDLHAENLAWWNNEPLLFDCIEFNEDFRWIDVMSDVAFLLMDLQFRGRPDFAHRFLNAYLSASGDYDGLSVLRFFLVYRAVVRAKVAALRATQADNSPNVADEQFALCAKYLTLAQDHTHTTTPTLVLLHGVSGSGKSVVAQSVAERNGAIILRSDIERKRLFGLTAHDRSGSTRDQGIYTASASDATYERLAELARSVVRNGYTAIVDATFLNATRRAAFWRIADDEDVGRAILHCHAPIEILRERVTQRMATGRDASEATIDVLQQQLALPDGLSPEELAIAIDVDTATAWRPETIIRQLDKSIRA